MEGLEAERVTFSSSIVGKMAKFEFTFTPALRPEDPPFDYEIVTGFASGHLMSRAAVEEAYKNDNFKHEYYGVRIDVPVNVIELGVEFPAGFKAAELGATALYGKTEIVAEAEAARAAKALQHPSELQAKIRIEDPLLSYIYAIHWMPAA